MADYFSIPKPATGTKKPMQFAQAVYDATGRRFFIRGGVDFKFLPRPTLTIKDTRLDNISGAATEAFVSIPEVVITPSLLPLLTGNIGIDDITLHNPVFAMEVLPNGSKSWDITPKAGANTAANLAQVTIKNGTIKAYNQESKYETKLLKLSGTFTQKNTQGAFLFKGELSRDNTSIGLNADVGALLGQGIIPLTLELKYGASTIGLKGTLQNIATEDGTVNLNLDAMVEQTLLPFGNRLLTPNGAEKRVRVTGVFNGQRALYKLSNLVLEGSSVKGSGEGVLDLSKPRPNVKLNVLLSNADFAAEVLLSEGATSLAPAVPKEQAINDPAFRVGDIGFGKYNEIDLFKEVDLVVDLGLTQAQFRKELVRDIRININSMEGGGLEVRNISARLPGDATFEAKGVLEDDQSVNAFCRPFYWQPQALWGSPQAIFRMATVRLATHPTRKTQ